MNNENLTKFLSEIQMLKRIKNEGFRLAGIENPNSIAEHSLLAAQIGFVLAGLEGADPYKTASILIFHDMAEIRTGDQTKINSRYLNKKQAEKDAFTDQLQLLPQNLTENISRLFEEIEDRNTKEGIVAKDADWLETAIQAKFYLEQGYKGCQNWINNVEKALETESAKKILADIKNCNDFTNIWWQGLKKMTYEKLGE